MAHLNSQASGEDVRNIRREISREKNLVTIKREKENDMRNLNTLTRDEMIRKIKEEKGADAAWQWIVDHPRD